MRTCTIDKKKFAMIEAWLDEQRTLWEVRLDRLEQFVTTQQSKEE